MTSALPGFPYGFPAQVKPAGPSLVADVSLSEVLAAMSSALDMTEGQEPGHTVRTCIIGMRMAEELNLSAFEKVALYGALLLKDAGCSGNSQRVAETLTADSPAQPHQAVAPSMTMRKRISSLLRRGSSGTGLQPSIEGSAGRRNRDEAWVLDGDCRRHSWNR